MYSVCSRRSEFSTALVIQAFDSPLLPEPICIPTFVAITTLSRPAPALEPIADHGFRLAALMARSPHRVDISGVDGV